jgi:hypothetical protein
MPRLVQNHAAKPYSFVMIKSLLLFHSRALHHEGHPRKEWLLLQRE